MADRNILTVSEAEITEGSFLFAEVNEQLVKVPVDKLPTGGGDGAPQGSNYVFVDDEPDNPDVVPDEAREPELNADMLGGKRPDEYTMRLQNKFSYEEKIVGEWIDGKPLYRRMVQIYGLPNNSVELYEIYNLENVNFAMIDVGHSYWMSKDSTENVYSFIRNGWEWRLATILTSSGLLKLEVFTAADASGYIGNFCLEYTKNTD